MRFIMGFFKRREKRIGLPDRKAQKRVWPRLIA
jgi:hypothetical protein